MAKKTYTDAEGREFHVPVTVGSVRRCKQLINVDLLDVVKEDGKLLVKLSEDVFTLVDVLYALCKPQCDAQGISDEQFGEGLVGDPIDAAAALLLEGLTNFFPGPKRRAIEKAIEKLNALREKTEQRMIANFNDPELNAKVEAGLEAVATKHLADAKRFADRELAKVLSPTSGN